MAKTHWQQALRSDPEHPGARRLQEAAVAHEEGRGRRQACRDRRPREGRGAVGVCFKCGRVPRRLPQASTNLKIAASYLELKDYANAKRHCDAVLSQDDKNVDALIKRTEAEIGAEDYEGQRRTAARARRFRMMTGRARPTKSRGRPQAVQGGEPLQGTRRAAGRAHLRDIKKASRRCVEIPPGQDRARRQRQRTRAADGQVPGDRRRVRKSCPTKKRAKSTPARTSPAAASSRRVSPESFPGFPGGFPGGGFQQGGQQFGYVSIVFILRLDY